jgi:5'-nucleotidase / UDP-sugar diphosphatase
MKAALSLTLIALLASGCVVKKTKNADVMDLEDTQTDTAVEPLTTTTPPVQTAPLEAEPSPQGARSHTIAAHDTPWNLAVKYYGDGKQWKKIVDANPGLTPERMPIGKKIVIP